MRASAALALLSARAVPRPPSLPGSPARGRCTEIMSQATDFSIPSLNYHVVVLLRIPGN